CLAGPGRKQGIKSKEANPPPANERLPRFQRRYHAHNPAAGRNASREVLVRAAIPQTSPNWSHGVSPSLSSRSSVSQKMSASSSAARLVSQTQRVHQNITDGKTAQIQ